MEILLDDLKLLTGLAEDSVEFFCDETFSSGELAWTIVQALATARLAELKGKL